jgi:nucleoside-diphosphate-sugar epimerase
MIVAITGGTGFIGRGLVRNHLDRGGAVRVLTRSLIDADQGAGCQWFQGDLAQGSGDLAGFVRGADILYHCAGEIRDPALMHPLHVEGTRRLIAAASGQVGRWVQLSSVGAYGPRWHGLVTEDTPLAPVGPYEVTKTQADEQVLSAAAKGAFDCAVVRPSTVFGPAMPNRSLFQLISLVRKGWFFFLGPPGASANYVYVDDVVNALMLCAEHPQARGRTYIVSDYRTMEQFVGTIAKVVGVGEPRWRLPEGPVRLAARLLQPLPGFPLKESRVDALVNRAVYSSRRIEDELGFAVGVPMEEGLRRLIAAAEGARLA